MTEPTLSLDAPEAGAQPASPRPPRRLAVAIALAVACWIGPLIAGGSVLLPARLEVLAPANKVTLLSTIAAVAAVVALVMNLVFGALSDRTRGRLGRRTPWMLLGSIGCAVGLLICGFAPNVATLIIGWLVFQLFVNAIIAGLIAVVPDRVPTAHQGSYSAVYGVSLMAGAGVGTAAAGAFVAHPSAGFFVFAVVVLLAGPVMAVLAPDRPSTDLPPSPLTTKTLFASFSFPTKGARDFYLAGAGKFLFVIAAYSVSGFQLYILTDFIGLAKADAGGIISITALINLVLGLLFGSISGPVSDRLGRRKVLVMGAAIVVAGGMVILAVFQSVPALFTYTVIGGIGLAVFNSVDQALNYEVLPSSASSAKDLGVLNVANTGGQIVGPAIAGGAIATGLGYGGLLYCLAGALVLSALVLAPIKKAR
ncbi:MFS transporter [Streptomyces griseiscabiei]|uniref:MFS transporter n=1 Tax=Streptomyces griseiscabiei TaxID=2993540 RepID=A0ABU4LFH8_9ACTN|nr:MFS transporter [Streptomyces griseiscabiei]MBZ3900373.1 MFS transporter [Streptomyces griseiscabiei]MDX2914541.1 MFS transporter [Streptomyces griseiscabiei]